MKMFVGEGVKLPFSLKEEISGCEWTTQGKADWLDGQQMGDERMLEMLSQVRLAEVETWLCTPSPVLPRRQRTPAQIARAKHTTASSDPASRMFERKAALSGNLPHPASASPDLQPHTSFSGQVIRKRRRLPRTPGGLHSKNPGYQPGTNDKTANSRGAEQVNYCFGHSDPWGNSHRSPLRKSISADDSLFPVVWKEHRTLFGRIRGGRNKIRRKHSLGLTVRTDSRQKKCLSCIMTQQMQNLNLSSPRNVCSPASPNAAKRLYRNLSDKFKGSQSSFEEALLAPKSDKVRLRRSSLYLQCSSALFQAVEQQNIEAVELLLTQYHVDELGLNTPNMEGLQALDIAIMTNNIAVARTLMKAGAKESPHLVSVESRTQLLTNLIQEAQDQVNDLSSEGLSERLDHDNTEREKQRRAWEWRYKLYKQMKTVLEYTMVPASPTNVSLTVTSSTSLTVTFQEPPCVNSGLVTRYKVEWSGLMDFSAQCGETKLEDLSSLTYTISGLITGRPYYVRVSAANMKGWGLPQTACPAFAIPSSEYKKQSFFRLSEKIDLSYG
ncbi:ankyrin repeat and fibronectin type-III domain-containing protein 1-like [Scyliorhinus canicula]|uniref:ankyrin repeat and fibronectin type-III domain-containing protein 1-like n=1 Tax=Scyliorhinus canicula TaxID=7830 RepID=UPI0018F6CA0D|nr:ankyrin repeat and fibronectin type-III domain-containing protein 1-like [Scyliorhinus canicula]